MWLWLAVPSASVLGHMYSMFLGLRGGKGVATAFGGMLAMWPLLTFPALGVMVIWYGMLATDLRSKWDGRILTDSRAVHFWDEGRVVGTWYAEQRGFSAHSVEWDTFYLYGADSLWTLDGVQPGLVQTGHTIFGARESLRDSLLPLIEN